ncbi:hypothetical protein TWF694_011239 [Orbilia ellipsospora]|uniref:Uncharacterized protein n=1 Tax=Orbilia ellipsospora TaxID=2528407 RepID=A0AAV9X8F6_9PEZI
MTRSPPRGHRQTSARRNRHIQLPPATTTEAATVPPSLPPPTVSTTKPPRPPESLNLADVIHLLLSLFATIFFLTDCFIFNPVTINWPDSYKPPFAVGVYIAYSFICRYAVHAVSMSMKFHWHEQRPLFGVGVLEHTGLASVYRLVKCIWKGIVSFVILLEGSTSDCRKDCRFCNDPVDGSYREVREGMILPGLGDTRRPAQVKKQWVINLKETNFVDVVQTQQ